MGNINVSVGLHTSNILANWSNSETGYTFISDTSYSNNSHELPSNVNEYIIENGVHITVDNKKYIVHKSGVNEPFTKVLDTANANATANDILSGKTAFVNNTKVTGTLQNNGAVNITPSTSLQNIPAGYTSGGTVSAVTSAIDSNIQANNIKKDVIILGVTGTYEGSADNRFVATDGLSFGSQESTAASIDLRNWNTSNVTDMSNMFNGCTNNLVSLNLSDWNVSNVTDMNRMFYNCQKLQTLNISGWNTSSLQNISEMFSSCKQLSSINVGSWNTSNITTMQNMFYNCQSLTSLDLSNWNTGNTTNIASMFSQCQNLTSLNLSGWDLSNVTSLNTMFGTCKKLQTLNLSSWDTSNITDMRSMFINTSNLLVFNFNQLNTSNVTNMNSMFSGGLKNSLDLSGFDTRKVENMGYMFASNTNLTTIDLSNFNIQKVTNMQNMFQNCSNLTDDSLNSILRMLSTVNDLAASNRKLSYINLPSALRTRCTNLSNWSLAEAAGWTVS